MASILEPIVLRRAGIYTIPGNPNDTLHHVYGDLTFGDQGVVPATEIKKWTGISQVFQIADHPIVASQAIQVFTDNVLVTTGYTFHPRVNFEGQGDVAVITFTTNQTGRQVSVRCLGKEKASGQLITNLADIIQDLLVRVHGVPAAQWDNASFMDLREACGAIGFVGGGVVMRDMLPLDVANEILSPLGQATIAGDGRISFFLETGQPPRIHEEFSEAEIDEIEMAWDIATIINSVVLQFVYNPRKESFSSQSDPYDLVGFKNDTQSVINYQLRQAPFASKWLRDVAAAGRIVDLLLALGSTPRAGIQLTLTGMKACTLRSNEVVAFTHRKYPGGNRRSVPGVLPIIAGAGYKRMMRVVQTTLSFSRSTIALAGADLLTNWWVLPFLANGLYLADGSIRAGGNPE